MPSTSLLKERVGLLMEDHAQFTDVALSAHEF